MATSLAVRPGRAVITAIRVDRYTDSYTLWVTNTTVQRWRAQSARRSLSSLNRVISSSDANGSATQSRRGGGTKGRGVGPRLLQPPPSSRGQGRPQPSGPPHPDRPLPPPGAP